MKTGKVLLIFFVILISYVLAADHDVYKTCNQSSFCKRNRNVKSNFRVDKTGLSISPYAMSIDLIDENNIRFVLTIRAIENEMFHFEIDEKFPLRPRYRVEDVLHKSPNYSKIFVVDTSFDITVYSGDNKAVVNLIELIGPEEFGPNFRIDFYKNGVKSLVINGNDLLRIEHLQKKPNETNLDDGLWEEKFLEYTDSKPNGPEAVALDFHFPESEVFFGIPEHADSHILKKTYGTNENEPYRLYTLDVTGYELNSRMPLYGAIPVIYGHGKEQTVGVFWHNSADTFVDIHDEKTTQFISETGIIDVFVMLGPKPNDAFKQYTDLTGVGTFPPMFSLGMHQSRWNYMSRAELLGVVENYDKEDIPLDTVWLDIEYTEDKKYFTWNLTSFENPTEMMSVLRSTGRHLTYIIDPHIKIDNNYFFYLNLLRENYFIKDREGKPFEGSCWPGPSHWIDFLNPNARQFYGRHYEMEVFRENAPDTGIWNDMNEPAVFDVAEKTIYKDALHWGGVEHRNVHNLYGYLHTKATYDGLMKRGNGDVRPFILTRSFFSGSQRYSAVWTGDNTADWGYLLASIQMCLTIGAAGVSFCGSDIGGFFGNPDEELQVRWTQAAVFQPFLRNHAAWGTDYREPYLLSQKHMEIARDAIKLRYLLLPFWYTMFYEHTRTGYPIMRSMLTQYPEVVSLYRVEDQYMLSDTILVAPVIESQVTKRTVHFPTKDIWYDTNTAKLVPLTLNSSESESVTFDVNMETIPWFIRGGSIIPEKLIPKKASIHMKDDPISFLVALDKDGNAKGTLFLDDEMSFAYLQGHYNYYSLHFHENKFHIEMIDHTEKYTTMNKYGMIMIFGYNGRPTEVKAVFEDERRNDEILDFTVEDTAIMIDASQLNIADKMYIQLTSGSMYIFANGLLITLVIVMLNIFK